MWFLSCLDLNLRKLPRTVHHLVPRNLQLTRAERRKLRRRKLRRRKLSRRILVASCQDFRHLMCMCQASHFSAASLSAPSFSATFSLAQQQALSAGQMFPLGDRLTLRACSLHISSWSAIRRLLCHVTRAVYPCQAATLLRTQALCEQPF